MSNKPTKTSNRLEAERDVRSRLGDIPLDFDSMDAISNIYRAAAAVRRQAEREILSTFGLSFGGFTILWVLWVWGEMETAELAAECDLAKGTLTGMLITLEKRELVARQRLKQDKRRVAVELTSKGKALISELFPKFNAFEADVSNGLTKAEKQELARLLRVVVNNASSS